LRFELLRVELDYRLARGERPDVADYEDRFPGFEPVIRHEIGKRWPEAGLAVAASAAVANEAPDPAAGRNDPWRKGMPTLPTPGSPTPALTRGVVAVIRTRGRYRRAARPTEQVGRYPVLGEIGRGGMGAVLRSRDPELGRDLALKVMLSAIADRPEAVQRFREEAQVGGSCSTPASCPSTSWAALTMAGSTSP